MSTKIITVASSTPAESTGADVNKGAPLNAAEFDQNLVNLRAAIDRRALANSTDAFTCGTLTAGRGSFVGSSYTNSGAVVQNTGATGGGDWRLIHFSGGGFSINRSSDTSGDSKLLIDTDGTVLVGTTTNAGTGKLQVNGTIVATGLRINASPSSSAATTTHKLSVNVNGSTYYLLLSNV